MLLNASRTGDVKKSEAFTKLIHGVFAGLTAADQRTEFPEVQAHGVWVGGNIPDENVLIVFFKSCIVLGRVLAHRCPEGLLTLESTPLRRRRQRGRWRTFRVHEVTHRRLRREPHWHAAPHLSRATVSRRET